MRRSRLLLALLGVAIATQLWAIALSSESDFQDGTLQGWQDGFAGNLTNQPDGGPTGGGDNYLEIVPDGSGPGGKVAAFNLGSDWTGDYATAGVVEITLDVKVFSGSALEMRVVLIGPSGGRWTSTSASTVPADGSWHNIGLSLAEAELTQVLGADTYAATIGSVSRLLLRHQSGAPSSGGTDYDGTVGFDNIWASDGLIFYDGFESGNTSAWSKTVP